MSEINLASHLNEVFTTIGADIKDLYQRTESSGSGGVTDPYIHTGDLNDYKRGRHLIRNTANLSNSPEDMLGGILHVSAVGNGTLMQLFLGFNRSSEFQIYTRQGWVGAHSWDRDRINWGNWKRFEQNISKYLLLFNDGSEGVPFDRASIAFLGNGKSLVIRTPSPDKDDQAILSFALFGGDNQNQLKNEIYLPNKSGEILVRRSDPELRWSGNATNGQRIHLGPLYDEHLILCLQASQHHSLADENPVHFSTVYVPFSKSNRVTTTINGNRFIYGSAFYFQGWKQTKIKLHEDAIELMDLSAMLLKAVYSM